MAIKLVHSAETHGGPSAKEELALQIALCGTPAGVLVESIERQTRIINLCALGFNDQYRKSKDPLERYANILWLANEQLRQDLLSLITVLRRG